MFAAPQEGRAPTLPALRDPFLIQLFFAAPLSNAEIMELLKHQHLPSDIWFVANSREEGMGDLGGMRAVYQRLAPRLGLGLIVEGIAFGRVYHAGIAVRRLEIQCHAPGGHSWLHFGRPSAIHGLVQLGAQITRGNRVRAQQRHPADQGQ